MAQRVVLSVLLLLTLALLAATWARPQWIVPRLAWTPDGEKTYDFNHDGRPDYVEIWDNGELRESRQDADFDGRFESRTRFRGGEPVAAEFDFDGDGAPDVRTGDAAAPVAPK